MKTISVNKVNDFFGWRETGVNLEFREVEYDGMIDFAENAEIGQCWTDEKGDTYYKIRDEKNDIIVFTLDDEGEILIM